MAQVAKEPERMSTIKVKESVRRWLKTQAAIDGVPMYVKLESMLSQAADGKPWEKKDG